MNRQSSAEQVTPGITTALQTDCDIISLTSCKGDWRLEVRPDGMINRLDMVFGSSWINVPWRGEGPSWMGVVLVRKDRHSLEFEGRSGEQIYSLAYSDEHGEFTITVGIRNEGAKAFTATPNVRLKLGIDHEMRDPKTYFNIFFPTLLRCEKTHFWGYFQNPNGQILVIASPDQVASWKLDYIGCGHRIATTNLDLLHALPLPPRHPQELKELAPGETRTWRICFQPVETLDAILPAVAEMCLAPALSLERTIAAPGEPVNLRIYFDASDALKVKIADSSGQPVSLPEPKLVKNSFQYQFPAPASVGPLLIQAEAGTKRSEAIVYVRKPWGWYLKQASNEALRMQQKPLQHREGWMGFFSAYLSQIYFPDERKLAEVEKEFQKLFSQLVDPSTGNFYQDRPTWPTRPQNSSWMLGLLVVRYAATREKEHLELAANWADQFIARFQKGDGAFVGYTSLTLGAKFLLELLCYERELSTADPHWIERLERHNRAIEKAGENILKVKDLGDTEGESTYEDNQAGSAWSLLALHALSSRNADKMQEYLDGSLEVRKRHECLTQALIPDGRMRGGTLRWWEAQYDVLTTPNMMNSPHGWTMRSQFGAFYLYLLTGEEYYLNLVTNAMGACVQAIDGKTGELRWAWNQTLRSS